ncbi:MAG TPA: GxxExxY protein [Acetobacteraceae bacterium]|jgi:GxxExxY protein
MHQDEIARNRISDRVIGCAFEVMNTLGVGFFEKVYENALAHELRKAGFKVAQQHGITVRYDDITVGDYIADMLIEDAVIVERKAVRTLDAVHTAQCINYLKASGLHLCLLLNFGKSRVEAHRLANGV